MHYSALKGAGLKCSIFLSKEIVNFILQQNKEEKSSEQKNQR